MKNQPEVEKLLELLELIIQEVRQAVSANLPLTKILAKIKAPRDDLIKFFSSLEENQELEHKKQIYSHIARFIQKKIDRYSNDWDTCLSAVYFLCGETDPKLLTEDIPSLQTKRVMAAAQEIIMAVKSHYERIKEADSCGLKTEIFSLRPEEGKPTITRIEEEISWDGLPLDVRDSFIREGKSSISFQIYPPE